MKWIKWMALSVALVVLAVNLVGCATASSYMKKEDQARVYNNSRQEVFDAVIASANDLRWKVESSDPATGMVYLHPPLNILTSSLANAMQGGDIVEIQLVKSGEQKTRVHVEQKSRGEIMDWGRAAGNIKALFRKLDSRLRK